MDVYKAVVNAGFSPRVAIDLASVASGVRKHILLHLPCAERVAALAIIERTGLVVEAYRELERQPDKGTGEFILRPTSASTLPHNAYIEIWVCRSGGEVDRHRLFEDPGSMLGYPACCTKRYELARPLAEYHRSYMWSTAPGHWENNRLAALFLPYLPIPDYFPCSLACDASKDFVAPVLRVAKNVLPNGVFDELTRCMKAPLVVTQEILVMLSGWRYEAGQIQAEASRGIAISITAVLADVPTGLMTTPFVIPFGHHGDATALQIHGGNSEVATVQIGAPKA